MGKKHTNLSLEIELVEQAKEAGLSMSELAEEAIRNALGKKKVEIDTTIKQCEFCGCEDEKTTKSNPKGITWLWPDERWCCSQCLINRVSEFNEKKKIKDLENTLQ
ncbi:MAG: hypothetical protein GWP19_00370 [Planctomycetia bacterium]|nr:hypothetical protein [Planctomycetia bacterium]